MGTHCRNHIVAPSGGMQQFPFRLPVGFMVALSSKMQLFKPRMKNSWWYWPMHVPHQTCVTMARAHGTPRAVQWLLLRKRHSTVPSKCTWCFETLAIYRFGDLGQLGDDSKT